MTADSVLPSLPWGSRILVVRLRSIGDIVLLTPALQLLNEWRRDLLVSVLVESRFRALLEGNADVAEVLGLEDVAGLGKILNRVQLLGELRRRKFALCVNVHGGPTSTFLSRFGGARYKAGFAHFRSQGMYDFVVPDARGILNQEIVHTAEHQASALFFLGMPRQKIPGARLFVSPAARAWWKLARASFALQENMAYAVLHPTALYSTKQWAPEHFAALGTYLERESGVAPLYTCGPGESATLDAVAASAGQPIRRFESPCLGEFLAVIEGAALFVGNDSGPAHISAALGKPSAVIFGSSSSSIWGPWRPEAPARVVQNFYDCNPCPGDRCYRFDRPECILSVSFDQVRAAVESVLARSARP